MLHSARVAGSANRLAPVQERRSVGTALVRGLFAPSMVWWMHPQGCQLASGSTVPAVQDFSGRGVTITQGTGSKQPLRGGVQGVPCFTFDGVNDSMSTSATNLTGTQALTVAVVEYRNNTTIGIEVELTTDQNMSATGCVVAANDGSTENFSTAFLGNAGYQYKVISTALCPKQTWASFVTVMDKMRPAATELAIYKSGAQVTSFSANLTANNTNAFANSAWYIGARNNASAFFNGSLAQILVLSTGLSDTAAAYLSLYLAQSAGVA